jgi:HEPN domain-containing protein
MSREKLQADARRWLAQARADIKAAQASLQAGSYEWTCFQCQQAGEKALKALWYWHGADPWGHSLARLIQEFPDPQTYVVLQTHLNHAKALDKLYIPTRYPNGLPDLIPAEVFTEEEARAALSSAQPFIDLAGRFIGHSDNK